MDETSRFIRPLLEFLFPAASAETITLYHAFIRKCAHFTEYAVLALLAYRALANVKFIDLAHPACSRHRASLDEFNQSFEGPVRAASMTFGSISSAERDDRRYLGQRADPPIIRRLTPFQCLRPTQKLPIPATFVSYLTLRVLYEIY